MLKSRVLQANLESILEFALTAPFPVYRGDHYEWYFLSSSNVTNNGVIASTWNLPLNKKESIRHAFESAAWDQASTVIRTDLRELIRFSIPFLLEELERDIQGAKAALSRAYGTREHEQKAVSRAEEIYELFKRMLASRYFDDALATLGVDEVSATGGFSLSFYRWNPEKFQWAGPFPLFPGSKRAEIAHALVGSTRSPYMNHNDNFVDVGMTETAVPVYAFGTVALEDVDEESMQIFRTLDSLGLNKFSSGLGRVEPAEVELFSWYHDRYNLDKKARRNADFQQRLHSAFQAHHRVTTDFGKRMYLGGFSARVFSSASTRHLLEYYGHQGRLHPRLPDNRFGRSDPEEVLARDIGSAHNPDFAPGKMILKALALMESRIGDKVGHFSRDRDLSHTVYDYFLAVAKVLEKGGANPFRCSTFYESSRCPENCDLLPRTWGSHAGYGWVPVFSEAQREAVNKWFLNKRTLWEIPGITITEEKGYSTQTVGKIRQQEFLWAFFPKFDNPLTAAHPKSLGLHVDDESLRWNRSIPSEMAQLFRERSLQLSARTGGNRLVDMPSPDGRTRDESYVVTSSRNQLSKTHKVRRFMRTISEDESAKALQRTRWRNVKPHWIHKPDDVVQPKLP